MLTTDELTMADDLLAKVCDLRGDMERARDYAKHRKLTEVSTEWPRRVEALSKCHGLIKEVATQVERAFS